jgi:hypothetical protein
VTGPLQLQPRLDEAAGGRHRRRLAERRRKSHPDRRDRRRIATASLFGRHARARQREVLETEGVHFVGDAADPRQRLTAELNELMIKA